MTEVSFFTYEGSSLHWLAEQPREAGMGLAAAALVGAALWRLQQRRRSRFVHTDSSRAPFAPAPERKTP